jgi:hypothetical protein
MEAHSEIFWVLVLHLKAVPLMFINHTAQTHYLKLLLETLHQTMSLQTYCSMLPTPDTSRSTSFASYSYLLKRHPSDCSICLPYWEEDPGANFACLARKMHYCCLDSGRQSGSIG